MLRIVSNLRRPVFLWFQIYDFLPVYWLYFSLVIGTLMAIFQLFTNRWVKAINLKRMSSFFRNIPLLIIVMFFMSWCRCIG